MSAIFDKLNMATTRQKGYKTTYKLYNKASNYRPIEKVKPGERAYKIRDYVFGSGRLVSMLDIFSYKVYGDWRDWSAGTIFVSKILAV